MAHAIYGLIVLTAVVGDLSTHDDDLRTAMALVAGGAIVLVFAHSYSQIVAVASMRHRRASRQLVVGTLVDQLALAIPAAGALVVFSLGEVGVLSTRVAYNVVIGGSLATLFGVGVMMGRHHGRGGAWSFALGVLNTAVGVVIIGIEAAAAH